MPMPHLLALPSIPSSIVLPSAFGLYKCEKCDGGGRGRLFSGSIGQGGSVAVDDGFILL